MSSAVERFDQAVRARFSGYGRTVVGEDELARHPVYTRVLHWSVASLFVLSLLSGFAIYTPWLFHWLTPLFGGGPTARLLHPWFAMGFAASFALQVFDWLRPMSWTSDDTRWMSRLKQYVTNAEAIEPEYVDFFNAGQKTYFWAIVVSSIVFLLSGIPMWFPQTFSRLTVAAGYVLHDIAALVMLVGIIVHIYEGTAAQPGTFRSMTRGTVEKRWAWTHHPAWYRRATGRDPRADYEAAVQRQAGRRPEGLC